MLFLPYFLLSFSFSFRTTIGRSHYKCCRFDNPCRRTRHCTELRCTTHRVNDVEICAYGSIKKMAVRKAWPQHCYVQNSNGHWRGSQLCDAPGHCPPRSTPSSPSNIISAFSASAGDLDLGLFIVVYVGQLNQKLEKVKIIITKKRSNSVQHTSRSVTLIVWKSWGGRGERDWFQQLVGQCLRVTS